ncbi:Extracellular membrane protein, CFEM domain protein [Metarhizium album ARSEF 1941]|uniref:Extracellular membrane protein, CFEM domain protein n=1 Tax=Metarhizium album (strain ARSEF 1941) TaxID=1081103 RepID=A0A0B2WML1_METAS|nr:Extracellular membrane protein, CFEM domain protein [Metarhizium album ARSEF 1941]KHN97271.1 Extracellular membrane protein, CFEM domain protein [Metarhizium album ARSEF 1941]
MKFTAVAAIAMAAVASAQSEVPSCALPCLNDAVKSQTKCATTDYACVCKEENFTKVQGAASSCVLEKCGTEVALNKVLPAAKALCDKAGSSGGAASTGMASGTQAQATDMAESTGMAKPSEMAQPTDMAQPAETESADCSAGAEPAGAEPAGTEPAVAEPTGMEAPPAPASNGTGAAPPAESAPVTAGAAGLAPIGGLVMLAIGALAL